MQRIGIGYDIHKFSSGKRLFIGGIEIPFEKGLEGHSDADVLLHAICDALLGALGRGDIGEHFPNTDAKYKDISSSLLLKNVNDMVQESGYIINNIDSVIIAEEPKLQEYKNQMKFHIAYELAIDESKVNVKATTQEGMGSLGRGEGIAAFATALIAKENA